MTDRRRDYAAIAAGLTAQGGRDERMQVVVDALWDGLADTGVSWVGFYLDQPGEPDDVRLVLGPHRDQFACSPLAMHGVCGQALRFRMPRIVEDVRELGKDYVACDPRDLSEIVIPMIDRDGQCWGVLDLDSFNLGAFSEEDEAGLKLVVTAAGLLEG